MADGLVRRQSRPRLLPPANHPAGGGARWSSAGTLDGSRLAAGGPCRRHDAGKTRTARHSCRGGTRRTPLRTGSAPAVWTAPASRVSAAWFRLDPLLDPTGTLAGQRLTAGRGGARWTADLPPESFASGPSRGGVLVGDDDGHRSRLRVLDAARGCWTMIATEAAVIRSAVRTSDGGVVRAPCGPGTRADLGVWRRDLASGRPDAVRVLPGLAPDLALGPTFATDLQLAGDGRLVVASCAERACRTRVLDPVTGGVAEVDGPGPVAGVAGSRLVAVAPCDGLPCRLEAVDLATGRVPPDLDEVDGPAVVAPGAPPLVVVADDRGLGGAWPSPIAAPATRICPGRQAWHPSGTAPRPARASRRRSASWRSRPAAMWATRQRFGSWTLPRPPAQRAGGAPVRLQRSPLRLVSAAAAPGTRRRRRCHRPGRDPRPSPRAGLAARHRAHVPLGDGRRPADRDAHRGQCRRGGALRRAVAPGRPRTRINSGAPNAVSYGTSNPCGVNGLACFQRDPANAYWHLWFRENGHDTTGARSRGAR